MARYIAPTEGPVLIPTRSGISPIGTTSPNSGSTKATNSTYAPNAYTSGIANQTGSTYTLNDTDYQGIVIFNTSSAVTVTLNSSVKTNFQATVLNIGTGAITITTNDGSPINGGSSSLTLNSGQGVQVFFAQRAWTAYAGTTVIQIVPHTTPAVSHEWLASYDATTGLFTQTQPSFADISGVATPSQLPIATTSALGAVQPDGTSITITSAGIISAVAGTSGGPIVSVTPTASPFSYTATGAGSMAVSGGYVTQITLTRGSTTVNVNQLNGFSPMISGDVLEVTYTTAPTMDFIPG